MAEGIKFSDDELKSISEIRTAQAEIDFESVKVKEQEVLKAITEKYGPGTLDPNTGVFTPSKS